MSKHICHLCRDAVSDVDFYFETPDGVVCSTCLVEQRPPREEIRRLFGDQPRKGAVPEWRWSPDSGQAAV